MVNRLFFAFVVLWLAGGRPVYADQSEAARRLFRETKVKADKGEAEWQLALGALYVTGTGVSPDLTKAARWHRKAAEQGLALAQYQLALDYARGEGLKEDKVEAVQWYFKAAAQGLLEAQLAAGLCYLYGEGVSANGAEALQWFRKAAARGSLQAEYQIGKCYMEGTGVAKNTSEGVKWIHRAAEAGFAPAQNSLGTLYEKGNGVEKDYVQAYKWFALAAAQDDAHAAEIRVSIAKVESFLTKEQIAAAQRAAREFKTVPTDSPAAESAAGGANTGDVIVNAEDETAEVFADGAFVGNSPARLKLKEGPHTIEVKKSGFVNYRRELNVTAGSELNLRVVLQKP